MSGTVNIERNDRDHEAREGMRLNNLDTVRTEIASKANLKLDDYKTAHLGEFTILHIDGQSAGYVLTLIAGEITTQVNKTLEDDENFAVRAGNIALGIRGTVFTVKLYEDIATISVESGLIAVMNTITNEEIEVLGEGETKQYNIETAKPVGGIQGSFTSSHFIYTDGSMFDHKGFNILFREDGTQNSDGTEGTYTLDGNTVTLTVPNFPSATGEFIENELHFFTPDGSVIIYIKG